MAVTSNSISKRGVVSSRSARSTVFISCRSTQTVGIPSQVTCSDRMRLPCNCRNCSNAAGTVWLLFSALDIKIIYFSYSLYISVIYTYLYVVWRSKLGRCNTIGRTHYALHRVRLFLNYALIIDHPTQRAPLPPYGLLQKD